ncbi:MAG: hypothetical protein ACHQQR_00405 [Gemmatimonadales bacterium]|jgi:hypothetical protein
MPSPSRLTIVVALAGLATAARPAIAQQQLPELPAGSFAPAQTQRWRALPLRDSVTTQCLMPVLRVTRGASDSMPVIKADSTRLEKMPVVRPGCVNPLNRK